MGDLKEKTFTTGAENSQEVQEGKTYNPLKENEGK